MAILQGGARKGAAGLELGSGQRILAAGGEKKGNLIYKSKPAGFANFLESLELKIKNKRVRVYKMKFNFFKKQVEEKSKWEKHKKHDSLDYITVDEIAIILLGFFIFYKFQSYEISFILGVIAWYWLKIRHFERKIIEKERDIYNVYYDNCKPVSQQVIDGRTAQDRKPMEYDLKQLNNKRKFLIDKFVVLNLVLLVLIQLFVNK